MTIHKDKTMQTIRDHKGNLISNVYVDADRDRDGTEIEWFVTVEHLDWYDDCLGESCPFMDTYSYWYDTKEDALKSFENTCKYERLTYQWD